MTTENSKERALRQYLEGINDNVTEDHAQYVYKEIGSFGFYVKPYPLNVSLRGFSRTEAATRGSNEFDTCCSSRRWKLFVSCISLLFFGDESHHIEMRLRTALKLLLHQQRYIDLAKSVRLWFPEIVDPHTPAASASFLSDLSPCLAHYSTVSVQHLVSKVSWVPVCRKFAVLLQSFADLARPMCLHAAVGADC